MAFSKKSKRQSSLGIGVVAVLALALSVGGFFFSTKQEANVLSVTTNTPVPGTTLSFSPSTASVPPGGIVNETIKIDTQLNDISKLYLVVTFNPQVFEATNLGTSGLNVPVPFAAGPTSIDNVTGRAVITMTASPNTSFKGTSAIALLTLKVKQGSATTESIKFGTETFVYAIGSTANMLIGYTPATITTYPGPLTTPTSTPRTGTPFPSRPTTPTPQTSCTPNLSTFAVDTPCGTNSFRYMSFTCQNGLSQREGGSTSCKDIPTWSSYAAAYCKSAGVCPSATPSPKVTVYPTRYPTRPTTVYPTYRITTPYPSKYPYPTSAPIPVR